MAWIQRTTSGLVLGLFGICETLGKDAVAEHSFIELLQGSIGRGMR